MGPGSGFTLRHSQAVTFGGCTPPHVIWSCGTCNTRARGAGCCGGVGYVVLIRSSCIALIAFLVVSELWLEYITFESVHDNLDRVQKIHRRATSQLKNAWEFQIKYQQWKEAI